jgi:hypothetical protein
MRHINTWLKGETEEDNLAAAAWNLFALMHYEGCGMVQFDNVPRYINDDQNTRCKEAFDNMALISTVPAETGSTIREPNRVISFEEAKKYPDGTKFWIEHTIVVKDQVFELTAGVLYKFPYNTTSSANDSYDGPSCWQLNNFTITLFRIWEKPYPPTDEERKKYPWSGKARP